MIARPAKSGVLVALAMKERMKAYGDMPEGVPQFYRILDCMSLTRGHLLMLASIEALLIIILAAVIIEPFIVARPQVVGAMQGMHMGSTTAQGMDPGMMQKFTDIPAGDPVPTVSFTITKDAVGGYDLHVETTNFAFTPELINTDAIPDQGHAHLYIDGQLTILLAPWYHIAALAPGIHTIAVSLNANDHSVFAVHGQPIQATEQFTAGAVQ